MVLSCLGLVTNIVVPFLLQYRAIGYVKQTPCWFLGVGLGHNLAILVQ